MAQCLRGLVALPEDQASVPNTHIALTTICNSSNSRDLLPSSDFCRHFIYAVHRHVQTIIYIKQKLKRKPKRKNVLTYKYYMATSHLHHHMFIFYILQLEVSENIFFFNDYT